MASKLKEALFKYVMEPALLKSIKPDFVRARPRLSLNGTSENKIMGVLQFYSIPNMMNENISLFGDFKLHQNKIAIGQTSRQVNFTKITAKGCNLHFELDRNHFIKDILDSNPIEVTTVVRKRKIMVEFSSPNIAKEFHVGHLRSTMMGNFIAKILKKTGNDVVTMNYLGDWGTQFGLLITGIELLGYTEESLNTDTLDKLNKAYIHANKMAAEDERIKEKAKDIFRQLENGNMEITKKWQQLKEWSKTDLEKLYKKLNVEFDEYDWESSYNSKKAEPLLTHLEKLGILRKDELGRKTVEVNGKLVPLVKSDGTTLYLLRDVLAFFDRRKRHQFDIVYYVADYSQGKHFTNLKHICQLIEPGSSDLIEHVQVGRILKMNTRAGTGVILHDVLTEARERMYQKQCSAKTTKGFPNMETSEALGISAIVIYDLMQGRERHYEFKWKGALSFQMESNTRLQYVHCRLCSLMKNSGHEIANECDPYAITEPEAVRLVLDIAGFEDAVHSAEIKLEPTILTNYLFQLASSVNVALRCLPVKKADPYIASQRLRLFNKSRLVIDEGLRLLGVIPLEEM